MVVHSFSLDVSKPGSQGVIYATRGDVGARRLVMRLVEDGAPVSLSAASSVVLRVAKPDDTFVLADCDVVDAEGGVVDHVLEASTLAALGRAACQLTVYGVDSDALFSPAFEIFVQPSVYDDAVAESSDDFSALTAALTEATALTAAWSNPSATAQAADQPGATVTVLPDGAGVQFDFALVRGDPGPAGAGGQSAIAKTATIPSNGWTEGTPVDGTFWWEYTVTDADVAADDMVVAFAADDASLAECATIHAGIITQTGSFKLRSNQQHSVAVNLQYSINKAGA